MINSLKLRYIDLSFLIFSAILSLSIPISLYIENYYIIALLFVVPLSLIIIFTFEKNFRLILICSIFIGFYFSMNYRVQVVNLIAYILIFYFIFNVKSGSFNFFKVPLIFRFISIILFLSVLLSSVASPFFSFISLYYAFMFLSYMLTGYIVYRSIVNLQIIEDYLNYFYLSVTVFGCFIILQIIISGIIRSNGISGPTIPDMISISLLIVLFKYFILNTEISKSRILSVAILTVVLITTLSRFAWIGFASSAVYGIFISAIYSYNRKEFFTKRLKYFLGALAFLIIVIFSSGLNSLIINRFSDVDTTVLDNSKNEAVVSNSLDSRGLIWITAFNAFLDNKLTGVGYFMFHKVSVKYNILPEILYYEFVYGLDTHSTFLGFLTETGIIGFTMVILYYIIAFIFSFKSIRISNTKSTRNTSIIFNIILFFMFTTSIYSGAFTFGYNGFVMHIFIWLTIANYICVKNQRNDRIILNKDSNSVLLLPSD